MKPKVSPPVATSALESHTAHPVDRHVGAALQRARKQRGWRQRDLAVRLGVTFQQIQKYESGETRLSASTLAAASQVLNLPVEAFFADLPDPVGVASESKIGAGRVGDFLAFEGAYDLARGVSRLPQDQRQAVLTLMRSLVVSPTGSEPSRVKGSVR